METSKRFAKRVLGSLKKITKRRYMKIMVTGVIMMGIACGLIMEGSAVYTISVDGEDLGYISSKRELNEIIETVDSELHDILEEEYEKGDIYDIVTVKKSLVSKADEADDEIKDTIMETVDGVEKMTVVYVDGNMAGAVADEETANKVLEEIKEDYSYPGAVTTKFAEEVVVTTECVNIEKQGMESEELYEVLNPENEESECALSVLSSSIDVCSKAIHYETEKTPDDEMYEGDTEVITEGENGFKDVTLRRMYINGESSGEIVLYETVTAEPVTEVVAEGTAERPLTASYGEFIWPFEGLITSPFGPRSGFGSSNHQGLDIDGDTGDDVMAADGGLVITAEWYSGYGNYIQILHDDGTVTGYAHLDGYYVSAGERVFRGQVIAPMGNTGTSSGSHLHFEVLIDGVRCNPVNYLP